MKKCLELTEPNSCLNRAKDDELIFVLRAKDPAAPTAVQAWIDARIMFGKNKPDDAKLVEARKWIEDVLATSQSPIAYDQAKQQQALLDRLHALNACFQQRLRVETDADNPFQRSTWLHNCKITDFELLKVIQDIARMTKP